jgi:hypothetical protein
LKRAADTIPGYDYASPSLSPSPVSLDELASLKVSVGFTDEDERYLHMAGEVLADQTRQIVLHWRSGIIARIPNLARHSKSPDGQPLPEYLAASNLRFEQWILDTCLRPYDQDWINYQQEIARRHTSAKKNQVDGVQSTPFVPLRDVMTFVAVMNETIKPYLATGGNSVEEVEKMHLAWCKSIQMQLALWIGPYGDTRRPPTEW